MAISKEISILKLVIDLIKVDNKIHRDEISCIERIVTHYKYNEEDIKAVHNISLSDAISTLQGLDLTERNTIINQLENIIASDNDIDLCERILLSCIRLALQEKTHDKVQIVNVDARGFDGYDNQLIYLEQRDFKGVKRTIKQNFETYNRQLKSLGIDFFFYPHIVQLFTQSHSYITPTIEWLFPTFSHINDGDKKELIHTCQTSDLYHFIRQLMGKKSEVVRFKSFLMLKVQNSTHNGQHTIDFMCIDCSSNTQSVMEKIIKSLSYEIPEESIPYAGCYRTFFEMLSEKSKQNYPLLLSGYSYYLQGEDPIALDIKGSERKTLFTLFLLHGHEGISNATFASLTKDSPLGREIITIYRYFANEKNYNLVENALQSNEEPLVIINLRDISKRNSHIGYIKRAFQAIPAIRDVKQYYPQNIKREYTYNITLDPILLKARHHTNEVEEALTLSFFI